MIHREATIKYKGYDPDDLSLKSSKRICAICDGCGRVRWVKKQNYRDLCLKCSKKGKDNPNWKGGEIIKICEICGCEFSALHSAANRKFCSIKCHGKWRSLNNVGENNHHWEGGKIIKICKECGQEFAVQKSRKDSGKFCSQECVGKWQSMHNTCKDNPNWKGRVVKACEYCGKEFSVQKYRQHTSRFCSIRCKGDWYSENAAGKNNHNWRGGEINKTCKVCGEKFSVCRAMDCRQFCSTECAGKWQSKYNTGENNSNWRGGISFEPYCPKFNDGLKQQIREKYNNCDFISGLHMDICNNSRNLDIHHIDYDKRQGCDDKKFMLIPLSKGNHTRTNANRPFWTRLFVYALEYDNGELANV